jgi:uncharacterized lipoprotein YajG
MKKLTILLSVFLFGCIPPSRIADMTPPVKVASVSEMPKRCRAQFIDAKGELITNDGEAMCNLKEGQILEIESK